MNKKALVISGGGSKGAFAGGLAQYLIEEAKQSYSLFFGTSTGSFLVSHLAGNEIASIKDAFTHVTQEKIFSNSPFIIKQSGKLVKTKINHFNVVKNFLNGKKTFGESKNLRKLLARHFDTSLFESLKSEARGCGLCFKFYRRIRWNTNLSECTYDDFLDWIWVVLQFFLPFMSLVVKNRFEYADGGFGCIIAIEEAIRRGATEIDAIMLTTEVQQLNRMRSRNAFDVVLSTLDFMGDQIIQDNIKVGQLLAKEKGVKLRLFYTPKVLDHEFFNI